jgi:cytoskeletal protein CcmA (bactofilin family)
MSDATEKKTLVEEGTEFKGSLTSKCPVEVRGRIDGDLNAPSLHVSESGAVSGKVYVGQLVSQGEIAGEFDAEAIYLSGTVKDNTVIRAKTLEVKLSPPSGNKMQVIFGEVAIDVGDAPRDAQASGKKKRDDNKSVPPPGE